MLWYERLKPLMKKILLLIIGVFALVAPLHSAHAAEIYSGENYFLSKDTIVPDNLVIASGRTEIAGLVKGDLIIGSGDVTISGQVDGDVIMAGGSLDLQDKGVIGKNLRAASGEIHIDGLIKGTVQVFAGSLISNGNINGNVYADVGNFYLNGIIRGSSKISARNIRLDQKAFVQGDLKYESMEPLRQDPNAKVQGQLINLPSQAEKPWYSEAGFWWQQLAHSVSYWLLALLLIGFLPKNISRLANAIGKNVLLNFLIGILTIGGTLLLTIFLAVTIVGLPLALLTAVLTIIALWLAPLGIIFWFTQNIAKRNWLDHANPALTALVLFISTFALVIIQSLPVIGPLVHVLTVTCGLGALSISKWQLYRETKASL